MCIAAPWGVKWVNVWACLIWALCSSVKRTVSLKGIGLRLGCNQPSVGPAYLNQNGAVLHWWCGLFRVRTELGWGAIRSPKTHPKPKRAVLVDDVALLHYLAGELQSAPLIFCLFTQCSILSRIFHFSPWFYKWHNCPWISLFSSVLVQTPFLADIYLQLPKTHITYTKVLRNEHNR